MSSSNHNIKPQRKKQSLGIGSIVSLIKSIQTLKMKWIVAQSHVILNLEEMSKIVTISVFLTKSLELITQSLYA